MLGLCGVTVTILNMAVLPLLGILPSELGASADGVSWVSTSILLAGAVANPVLGRLGDLFGKRRVLLASLGACAIGSALSAVAGSLGPMLVGRTLQGFAMGLIPLGISIARDELPPHRVAGGIALVSATIGIGSGLGLPFAGVVTDLLGWPAVFWSAAALALVAFVAAVKVIPLSTVRAEGRFDGIGARCGCRSGSCSSSSL